MSSRPNCYRCNEYIAIGGCKCKEPAFGPEDVKIGGRPESCGYLWDGGTWIRPWNGETIKPEDKPEWNKYIPDEEVKKAYSLVIRAKAALEKRQKARRWLNGFMGNHKGDLITDDKDEVQTQLNATINHNLDLIIEHILDDSTANIIFDIDSDDFKMVLKMVQERYVE